MSDGTTYGGPNACLLTAHEAWWIGEEKFEEGEWIVEAVTAGQALMQNPPDYVAVRPIAVDNCGLRDVLDPPESVLVVRSGGFGDVMFTTPLLREIHHRWPAAHLGLATMFRFSGAVNTLHPVWDHKLLTEDYPIPARIWRGYERKVWLDGIMEWEPQAQELHAVDVIARAAGLEISEATGRWLTPPWWDDALLERYPVGGRHRIGLQLRASAECRTYPWKLMRGLIGQLAALNNCEVFVFGSPARPNAELQALAEKGVHWLPALKQPPNFEESCGLLRTMDVVVAPDSAICHAAGAYGIPVVALYGPFPWRIRTAHAKSVRAIQGHAECAPCYWHERTGPWPKGQPCETLGHCKAMASIEPERIVREVVKVLKDGSGKEAVTSDGAR